jgi:uncharacterized membrane protein YbhN (UPF0104 family)
VLAGVWSSVVKLRAARISHRRLGLENLRLADDGTVVVMTFDHAVLGAAPDLLTDDLVEIMCATATRVGTERSVAAAADAIGTEALALVLPRWQPLVLSATTRRAVRAQEGLFEEMRAELRRVCRVEAVPLEQVERIRPLTVVVVAMSAVAVYLILPELVRTSAFVPRLVRASPPWMLGALTASALTYVAAAVALSGAVTAPVRIRRLTVAQVACQFADFASPLRIGAMALNTRFLQRRGVDSPAAVAAVGLNAAASFVTHMALLGVFSYWLGNSDVGVALPGGPVVAVVAGGVVVVVVTVLAVPAGRRVLARQVTPLVGRALIGLREIGRRPTKIIVLFTGTFLLSILYIGALACAVQAAGGELPLAAVGVVFLGAAVVASAAPTPSGLGAVEGALTAGLVGVGLDADTALLAVVLFRLATFWLPLLPGWLAFQRLQRRGDI